MERGVVDSHALGHKFVPPRRLKARRSEINILPVCQGPGANSGGKEKGGLAAFKVGVFQAPVSWEEQIGTPLG